MITNQDRAEIAAYITERDEVVRSLDVDRVIAFHKKHNPRGPGFSTRHVAEIAMHNTRLHINALTEPEKEISRAWLRSHGYSVDY